MKVIFLILLLSTSCFPMEHGHIEAHSNGNSITIDIESSPELVRSRHVPGVELPSTEPESDNAKIKIAGITAGATACTAITALCTALVTAGVTVAVTYSQCNK